MFNFQTFLLENLFSLCSNIWLVSQIRTVTLSLSLSGRLIRRFLCSGGPGGAYCQRRRTSGPSDRSAPPCVWGAVRTAHASLKDLCGALAPAHRLAGGTDCRPAAANHSHRRRLLKDVSANQELLGAGGVGAVPEWDELQLRGGDVLRLAGESQERPQGEATPAGCSGWTTGEMVVPPAGLMRILSGSGEKCLFGSRRFWRSTGFYCLVMWQLVQVLVGGVTWWPLLLWAVVVLLFWPDGSEPVNPKSRQEPEGDSAAIRTDPMSFQRRERTPANFSSPTLRHMAQQLHWTWTRTRTSACSGPDFLP